MNDENYKIKVFINSLSMQKKRKQAGAGAVPSSC